MLCIASDYEILRCTISTSSQDHAVLNVSSSLLTRRAAIRPGFPGFVLVWRPSGGRPGGVSRSVRGKPGHFSQGRLNLWCLGMRITQAPRAQRRRRAPTPTPYRPRASRFQRTITRFERIRSQTGFLITIDKSTNQANS
ncbi:hypothetical protein B5X24_HaOG207150 [Helicoverpa armigera]|uniref:Uncharacterized protein n=1 Tax=Helicoverpa armigera TaxID=29058 RepID=A0A2W1BNF8_HELAM|nr:hypothetical protein B5X24_HaOG207150 [Helicoverpa armigera]